MPAVKGNAPEWEEIRTGMGTSIDLAEGDAITGVYVGPSSMELDDRMQSVYRIAVQDGPEDGFMWGSWELDKAFAEIEPGTIVRVTYVGKRDIGPGRQPMRHYRVQVARGQ
jgi:hypothetical protein